MARIIKLRGDGHSEIQQLLPWYVAGRLEPSERAQVEAHLDACPECQADVRFEGRLNAEMAELPASVEPSWARMLDRIEPSRRGVRGWFGRWRVAGPVLGWALAAQALLLLVAAVVVSPSLQGRYHALGAGAADPKGNVVVIFRPDLPEKALREALTTRNARIVDGPTAAGGYVLQVPAATRAAVLSGLRGDGRIILAEPIDAGAGP